MNKNQKMLGTEKIWKLILKFSLPAIVGMLVGALYNIIDRIFIGQRVGPYAISGVGLVFPLMAILLAFGLLFGVGGATLISIRLGEKKLDEAETILGNVFMLLVVLAIVITGLGIIFIKPILLLVGASDQTYIFAKQYMDIIISGTIFSMLSVGMNHSIRSEGNPKIAMYTNLVGVITNVILDYIFIFIFNWGIKGAAYATIAGQAFSTIWILYYFTKGKSHLKLKIDHMTPKLSLIKGIVAIGASSFFIQITGSLAGTVANRALKETGGDLAIGAMAIIMSTVMLFTMPIVGLRQGLQPIIGYNYGAKRLDRVKKAFFLGSIIATVIAIIGFLIMEIFSKYLMMIFTKNNDIINIGVFGMRIVVCMLYIVGFQIIIATFFQATGDSKTSLFLSLLRQALLLIPLLSILPNIFQIKGVWISYPLADFLSVIISTILIIRKFNSLNMSNKNKPIKKTL